MRDSKVLFRDKVAPSTASGVVDTGGSEPGVGKRAMISATYDPTGGTPPAGDVVLTITASDDPTGTFVTVDAITIPQARAVLGGVIVSTPIPSTALRYLKTAWTGLTGGLLTDGVDYGLRDGTPAKAPYLY